MRNNYIIYKAENFVNSKVYIGCTSNSVNRRKINHKSDSKKEKKVKFHKAISTYGADAFKWTQIDTASNLDELAKKEKEYILKYNSKKNGYNSDNGGGIQKTIYQYDLDGKFVKSYVCLQDAADSINVKKKQISRVCLSVNNMLKQFYWSYEYVERFIPNRDLRKKKVGQYTTDGELLKEFKSISDASKQTGCNKTSIAKVCREERKLCGGYFWKYL